MNKKIVFFSLAVITLSMILTAFFYPRLPQTIATHFNFSGEADGFSPRWMVFIIGGIFPLGLLGLFFIVPKIDPKKESYKKHQRAYEIFSVFMVVFLTGVHWLLMIKALGFNVPITASVMCAIGAMFLIIGNYMPQIRPNYTFGIRVPWTLDNENNWRVTHRLGGWSFSAAGLLSIVSAFLPKTAGLAIFICALAGSAIIPITYSFFYSRIKQNV